MKLQQNITFSLIFFLAVIVVGNVKGDENINISSLKYTNEFENGEEVSSVANRLVMFDATIPHAGTTNNCDTPYRAVLNLNFIPKEK